jgi:N-ethylmaleimide reductase
MQLQPSPTLLHATQAAKYLEDGTADLVAFGVLYIANANLPELLAAGCTDLNWGGGDPKDDAKAYTDWPLQEVPAAA